MAMKEKAKSGGSMEGRQMAMIDKLNGKAGGMEHAANKSGKGKKMQPKGRSAMGKGKDCY